MLDWSVVPTSLLKKWFDYIASQSEIDELAAIANFVHLSDNEKIARGIAFLQAQIDSNTAIISAADAANAAKKATLQAQITGATAAIAALEAMVTP